MSKKNIYKILTCLIFWCTFNQCTRIFAQQLPLSSLYMHHYLSVNPGAAGMDKKINAVLLRREKWNDIEGAPQVSILNLDTQLKFFQRTHGVGLELFQESIGEEVNTTIKLAYAYKLPLYSGILSVGLDFGFYNKELKGSAFGISDPAIPSFDDGSSTFDGNLGVFYTKDKLYLGLSVANILGSEIKFNAEKGNYALKNQRNYFLCGGYSFKIWDDKMELLPSAMVRYASYKMQYELSNTLVYKKFIVGGLSYRRGDSFILMGGVQLLNGLKVVLAKDIQFTKLAKFGMNPTEFMVSYKFDILKNKKKTIYRTSRDL